MCRLVSAEQFALCFNPIALSMAKTLWSFGHSERNRVKTLPLMITECVIIEILYVCGKSQFISGFLKNSLALIFCFFEIRS